MPPALFGLSPTAPELDAPSLSGETLFPRPATDRKMVVSNLSQQNPKIVREKCRKKIEKGKKKEKQQMW
jgi:hypothetical protein